VGLIGLFVPEAYGTGWGSIGTGYNVAMGPIRLQVRRDDEEAAKELLSRPPPLEIVEEDG